MSRARRRPPRCSWGPPSSRTSSMTTGEHACNRGLANRPLTSATALDMQEHGLDTETLAVAAACIALWALTARRLASWNISSAMAMVVLGVVVTNPPLDLIDLSPSSESVQLITELALALVLFSDASRVNLRALRTDPGLPTRLL